MTRRDGEVGGSARARSGRDRDAAGDWNALQDRLAARAVAFGADHSREIGRRLAGAGISVGDVAGVADLRAIPVLAKDDLPALQAADPPFGGMLAVPAGSLARIYRSPGPINDPQGDGDDFWRFAPALRAAGFRPGEVVLNSFSYHLTPGGLMLDGGLRAAGCAVIPGGVGATAAQIDARAAGADRLHRHAPVPAHPARAGGSGGPAAGVRARAGDGRAPATVVAGPPPGRLRRGRLPGLRHGGHRAARLRVRREERVARGARGGGRGAGPRDDHPAAAGEAGQVVVTSPTKSTRSYASAPATCPRGTARPARAAAPGRGWRAFWAGWARASR